MSHARTVGRERNPADRPAISAACHDPRLAGGLAMAERVIPLPLDSVNAAALMRLRGVTADVIHLDAGHEEASVAADLRAWWPVLRPGGLFIADDYDSLGGKFPGVTRAVDAFCIAFGVRGPWSFQGKCKFIKSGDHSDAHEAHRH